MRYQRLDLNLLPALRALLAERSVTRAAQQLHLSQPAMSGSLARLRAFFDDPLIVPVGRRMALTPLGETLQQQLGELMLRLDATLATRPHFDPASAQRHVTVVASDYVIEVLLLDVLRRLHHEAPGLRLAFRQPSNTAALDLANGEVDFVINPARFATPDQAAAVLFEDSYQLVADARHTPLGDLVSLEQFRALRHVALQVNGRPHFEAWFSAQHGELPGTEVTVHSFGLLPQLVLGTQRVATLHSRMALQVAGRWPLKRVRLGFEVPRLVETLQWHHLRDTDPALQYLRGLITGAAQALPPVEALEALEAP